MSPGGSALSSPDPQGVAPPGSAHTPLQAVRAAADDLTAALEIAATLAPDETERLHALIEPLLTHLDRREITRLLLGRAAGKADEAELGAFADALVERQLALHGRALRDLQGFELRLLAVPSGAGAAGARHAVVPVAVRARGLPEITLRVHLLRTEDRWRIYDVSLFGMGLIGLQRPVFTALAAEHGVDGLTKLLRGVSTRH